MYLLYVGRDSEFNVTLMSVWMSAMRASVILVRPFHCLSLWAPTFGCIVKFWTDVTENQDRDLVLVEVVSEIVDDVDFLLYVLEAGSDHIAGRRTAVNFLFL